MGGGDLNLKKSWHPSTLRNIERVWKAEQKHDAEQKKIEQLQKELAEEKAKEDMRQFAENQGVVKRKNDRLDWMYQGPAALVDRDQYLMGRRVDTTFEILEKMESKDHNTQEMDVQQPGAIFGQQQVSVTVDLANKIREDPLFAIRKRETEQMKNLLTNPVKMKQLRDMLQQSVSEKERERKKKKKNKKEKKKRRNKDSSSSEDEGRHAKKTKHADRKSVQDEERRDRSNDDRNASDHKQKSKPYGLIMGEKTRERMNAVSGRHRSRSPISQKKPENDSKMRKRSRSPPRRKLTAEEMARKRQEMMVDAKWRKEQCTFNVKRYKDEEEKESHRNRKDSDSNSNNSGRKESQFYKAMLNKVADIGSVESRVKQKIYNIQRSKNAMDVNFARR